MTLRVACVGAGYFAQFHLDSWRRLDAVALVGVCDRDKGRALATGLPAFASLENMLVSERPDLLDIILPPAGHAQAVREALAHGVKWMVCQKPFCRDLEEARAVAAEVDAAGAQLLIHENFRFQPWYRAIKGAIDKGRVGVLSQITFRLRPGDGQGPDAYLDRQPYFRDMPNLLIHETGVHFIDTFKYLLGEPATAVYADLRRVNPVISGEDAGYVIFDHASGARALFDGNRTLDHEAENRRCTMGEALIEGSRGTLQLLGDGSVWHRAFGAKSETEVLAADTTGQFGGDCVHHLQAHVVAAILDGAPAENTVAEYLDVLEVRDAIYLSDETGAKVRRKGLGMP